MIRLRTQAAQGQPASCGRMGQVGRHSGAGPAAPAKVSAGRAESRLMAARHGNCSAPAKAVVRTARSEVVAAKS